MKFAFASAGEIRFGNGLSLEIASVLTQQLKRIAVVTGSNPNRQQAVLDRLKSAGLSLDFHTVDREPDIELIESSAEKARAFKAQAVIAIGGGSVVDTGKALAALLGNEGELLSYLEVVGQGRPLANPSVPMVAVPTTAGTGSEVTRNSVIGVKEAGVKVSMRSPFMIPRWAIIDPELTYNIPSEISAYTGMDALIQCIEAYVSNCANPLTDGVAAQGIKLAARSLKTACGSSLDRQAKEDMCAASVCGGLALANAKLGAIHGFAGPLGGMIDAPHGAICASLLLATWKANYTALAKRAPSSPSLAKMDSVARILTENPEAKGNYAAAWFEKLIGELPLQRLGQLGFDRNQISEAARKSANSSSMKGNPIELTQHELKDILEASI